MFSEVLDKYCNTKVWSKRTIVDILLQFSLFVKTPYCSRHGPTSK